MGKEFVFNVYEETEVSFRSYCATYTYFYDIPGPVITPSSTKPPLYSPYKT